ncbi:MAG: histidine phosphatase family protein [Beijerinckiaceae bacterium]|nr:histidine phosphatase family protein [Beijerinckiaceae bacterium]
MPRLLLLRHAEAVSHAPVGDSDRPLTPQGRADAARAGIYLRESCLLPDRALSSPALRARDTLDAILRELPQKPVSCELDSSLYYADAEILLDVLMRTPDAVTTLLIVAHNPGVGQFARFLVNQESTLPAHFPAPSLAVISFACGDWSNTGNRSGSVELFVNFSSTQADDQV